MASKIKSDLTDLTPMEETHLRLGVDALREAVDCLSWVYLSGQDHGVERSEFKTTVLDPIAAALANFNPRNQEAEK